MADILSNDSLNTDGKKKTRLYMKGLTMNMAHGPGPNAKIQSFGGYSCVLLQLLSQNSTASNLQIYKPKLTAMSFIIGKSDAHCNAHYHL